MPIRTPCASTTEMLRRPVESALGALVAVEYLRPPKALQRFRQDIQAEAHIHAVTQPPSEPTTSVHVNDPHQVTEAPSHGDVGHVRGRNLVRAVDVEPVEQVGVDLVTRPGTALGSARRQVDGTQVHHAHRAQHALAVDREALLPQLVHQPAATQERPKQVNLVHDPHDLKVLGWYSHRLIVDAGAAHG